MYTPQSARFHATVLSIENAMLNARLRDLRKNCPHAEEIEQNAQDGKYGTCDVCGQHLRKDPSLGWVADR